MLLLQPCTKLPYALQPTDIQLPVPDPHLTSILNQHLGFLELRVAVQRFNGLGATFGGAGGEVDEERAGLEGTSGVLEGEVADFVGALVCRVLWSTRAR